MKIFPLLILLINPLLAELTWPQDQAIPWFPKPAATLDAISIRGLSDDDLITLSAFQGQVNRKQPRIFLIDPRAEEGSDTWPDTPTIELGPRKILTRNTLLKKYASEFKGAVLYDPSPSSHFRNLSGTVAALEKALPMTKDLHQELEKDGIDFKILVDLTKIPLSTPLEIYQHLYDNYWPRCTKRIILSARPGRRGDHHHTRDLASAVGAAVLWLDCRIPAERNLMKRYLGDMKAGDAVLLGWHATERSGVTTASEFGIGTMPSDHFMNASVYAGGDHQIKIPAVPENPKLNNKAYIALFISDGDNIQYNQHAMRRIWDRAKDDRGKIALNWTIAPGLVDIAPGILNYYYTTATPFDCFVSGPSGMGYLMPANTLKEPGAPIGPYLVDPARMAGYAELTERYLKRSGLRVVTVWDDATEMQRAAYEKHCPSLLGVTVQNFKDVPGVRSSIVNERLAFEKLVIPYATTFEHLYGSLRRQLRKKDPSKPLFLPYQINIWKELKPDQLNKLADKLKLEFPDTIEFVRADHYFQLLRESRSKG